jgi:hypothetical protein
MAKRPPDKLTVSKLDAARRQIESAISLWFSDGDEVAIHTLTAAGHQVCHALTKSKGEKASILFNMDWLALEYHKDYKQFILRPENFFKHATKDADPLAAITFNRSLTDVYVFDACNLFHRLNGKRTALNDGVSVSISAYAPRAGPKRVSASTQGTYLG